MLETVLSVVGLIIFAALYAGGIVAVHQAVDNRLTQEELAIERCLDSGGYPVTLRTYIKGVGKGDVCIKSVELVK